MLLRRVLTPFEVFETQKGENFWIITLLNANTEIQYAQQYVYQPPRKSKAAAWTPAEMAIEAARRLNEYRGLVTLQEFKDNVCAFMGMFVSNSMWTFCVQSTDPVRCPIVKPFPDGWKPGEPFPETLKRVEVKSLNEVVHHPVHPGRTGVGELCKTAQKLLP
jgi:hypothetical protein